METPSNPSATSSNFSEQWNRFVQLLYVRAWTIVTFAMITFFVVAVGTLLQTKIYRAVATVLIDKEPQTVLSVSTTRDESILGRSEYMAYADYY